MAVWVAMVKIMKKWLLFLGMFTCPFCFGQTGAHRISQVIVKGNGVTANVVPYARIDPGDSGGMQACLSTPAASRACSDMDRERQSRRLRVQRHGNGLVSDWLPADEHARAFRAAAVGPAAIRNPRDGHLSAFGGGSGWYGSCGTLAASYGDSALMEGRWNGF